MNHKGLRVLGLLCALGLAAGSIGYAAELRHRRACERRVSALGARAPEWRNPTGTGLCSGESRAEALTLLDVLEEHPELPRPYVRVEPSLVGRSAQVDVGSGEILAPPEDPALRDSAVWVHELAHVQAIGRRPSEPIAQRLLRAIEEGAADYYAASLSGSTTLGVVEGRAQRDLGQVVEIQATEWSALALGAADPHRFGWALGARLWQRFGANQVVAADLLVGLARLEPDGAVGAKVVRALIAAIPQRSRKLLSHSLLAWLPAELQPLARIENTN